MVAIPAFLANKKVVWLICFMAVAAMAVGSYIIGGEIRYNSDFTVFWQAGINFSNGSSLYKQIGGAERYIYPPFAAMLFQVFGLFTLHNAARLFCFVNFLLWLGIFYSTKQIFELFKIPTRNIQLGLLVGFILSFRYFWYHLHFIQLNNLILFMSLVAAKAIIEKKNRYAVFLLVCAVFIKVIPVLLLIWALVKSPRKTVLYAFIFALICFLLPMLFRGFSAGINDLKEYYLSFLVPFERGRVEPEVQNYGLVAALYKMFSVTSGGTQYGYSVIQLPSVLLKGITLTMIAMLVFTYAALLICSQYIRRQTSLAEISFILLFTHLVSPITWEYHLVSLGFVFAVITVRFLNTYSKNRVIYYVLFAVIVLNDLVGISTLGQSLFYKCSGYGLLTFMLLSLAIFEAYTYFGRYRNYPVIAS